MSGSSSRASRSGRWPSSTARLVHDGNKVWLMTADGKLETREIDVLYKGAEKSWPPTGCKPASENRDHRPVGTGRRYGPADPRPDGQGAGGTDGMRKPGEKRSGKAEMINPLKPSPGGYRTRPDRLDGDQPGHRQPADAGPVDRRVVPGPADQAGGLPRFRNRHGDHQRFLFRCQPRGGRARRHPGHRAGRRRAWTESRRSRRRQARIRAASW